MPYVCVTTAKKIDDAKKTALQKEIGDLIPILPGKDINNTLLAINDGVSMFKGNKANEGVFIDIRLYKSSPEENKKEFAAKLYDLLVEILDLPSDSCIYLNFVEMEKWAANGNYF